MITHEVKSWSHFFDAIESGHKKHDLRKNDRKYKVGDTLRLWKYDNINGRFTGHMIDRKITYITSREVPCAFSSAVLEPDYCILSLGDAR